MSSKSDLLSHIKKATKAIKEGNINTVNFPNLKVELNQLFKIYLPDASFQRQVTDYEISRVTDTSDTRRVGIYTQHGTKEVKTAVGSHMEEDRGKLDSSEKSQAFALFEACIQHTSETGDSSKTGEIINAFLEWKHYWTEAEGMAAGIKNLVEQKKLDKEAAASTEKSQDLIDFDAFVTTGGVPKWYLVQKPVYPEIVSDSLKRFPGNLHESVIRHKDILLSSNVDGSMQILLRSVRFEDAPATKHWSATADPYLKIWGSNKDFHTGKPTKTSIINNTLTPAWNDLNMSIESRSTVIYGSEVENVIVEVWNDNKFKDSFMSSAIIDCSELAALGLRRLRSLGDASATKVDLIVRVEFTCAKTTKSMIPPDRYKVNNMLVERNQPEKREVVLDMQLTLHPSVVAAAFANMSEKL